MIPHDRRTLLHLVRAGDQVEVIRDPGCDRFRARTENRPPRATLSDGREQAPRDRRRRGPRGSEARRLRRARRSTQRSTPIKGTERRSGSFRGGDSRRRVIGQLGGGRDHLHGHRGHRSIRLRSTRLDTRHRQRSAIHGEPLLAGDGRAFSQMEPVSETLSISSCNTRRETEAGAAATRANYNGLLNSRSSSPDPQDRAPRRPAPRWRAASPPALAFRPPFTHAVASPRDFAGTIS